jgi:hypothetical protein
MPKERPIVIDGANVAYIEQTQERSPMTGLRNIRSASNGLRNSECP